MTLLSLRAGEAVAAPGPGARSPRRGEAALAWREARNKLAAYWLVRTRGSGPHPAPGASWADLVAAVYRREPWSALFKLERLGIDLVAAAWPPKAPPPRGLLAGPRAAELPEGSLILLHGGMGMAFARRLIGGVGRGGGEAELAAALGRFVELCRANSRPGYEESAFEPLGALVRVFHPRLAARVDPLLAALDPAARACYWHGLGRGVYFLPAHCIPGSAARALAQCRREAAAPAVRDDALDGFFFAAAMVNLRHPRVLEAIVAAAGARPEEEAAVAGGITGCVLARYETTSGDPAIPALLAHRPDPGHAALWERRVRGPVELGLHRYYPLVKARGRLASLARHRHLPAFAAELS